ncbi:G-protein coupled receptor C02B8.5 [Biomphalaria glabrata]|nr:putative G-protein coupled receptor C02B8.5 [Biomphalaria glabrata]KAI8750580.1 G-protein coupled receptor C02B8.5 [Biomphalaria glabrata]
MGNTFQEDNVPYFVWPHINYFPIAESEDENTVSRRLATAMLRIVIPAISLLGIVGNISNMVILLKGKLNKSSTWLILALAAADTTFLFGVNNVPELLYARGRKMGFDYPEIQAHVLYCVYFIQKCLEIVGKVSSMMLPCLITFDRLIAVIVPFRYPRIMTVNRVRTTSMSVYILSLISYSFYCLKFTFKYIPETQINIPSNQLLKNPEVNFTFMAIFNITSNQLLKNPEVNFTFVGIFAKSTFYNSNTRMYMTVVKTIAFLYGPANLFLTVIGCVIVGFWIQFYTNNRTKLLAGKNEARSAASCFGKLLSLKKTSAREDNKHPVAPCEDIHYAISSAKGEASVFILDQLVVHNEFLTTMTSIKATSIKAKKVSCDLKMNIFVTDPLTQRHEKTLATDTKACTRDNSKAERFKVVKRRKSKTTRTLLSVCLVYSVANIINFFVLFCYDYNFVSSSEVAIGLESIHKTIMVVNSACNFLFYVGLNRNFKESYRKFFCKCCR